MTQSDHIVTYTNSDGVARIRLNRPQVLNALSIEMYSEVRRAVRRADGDPEVDIIVISGNGRAFATGGDLAEVLACIAEGPSGISIFDFEDAMPFEAIKRVTKPTIAAVDGLCYAGGVIIAAVCDIAIATHASEFCVPESRVGIAEPVVPWAMWGKVSTAKSAYYILTGKAFSAATAEAIGLITEAVPDEALDERVDEIVDELRRTSPYARRLYKEYLARLVPQVNLRGLQDAMRSAEGIEGLTAFAEKRRPNFDARR